MYKYKMQGSSLFPQHEYQKYKKYYSEASQDKTVISYRDFVSILKHIKSLEQSSIQKVLEKIKKMQRIEQGMMQKHQFK